MYIVQLKIAGWNDKFECKTLDEAVAEIYRMLDEGYTSGMLRIVKVVEMEVNSVHTINVSDDE